MKLIKPTQINEYQETKADRIIETVFIIGLSLILLFLSVLILATTSFAANSYFPMGQNDNSLFSETALNYINSHYDSENNYIFARSYGTLSGGRPAYCVFYWPKSSDTMYYSELLTNGYQFSLFKSGSANPTMKYFYVNNGTCTEYTWTQANWNQNFQNQNSSLYNTSISFVSNFQVYTNANKDKVVLKYGESPFQPAQGHATQTDFDNNDNITSTGHAQQPSSPTFPIFTPPNIDTSTLETLVESLIDFVGEFADFVGECFSVFFSWLVGVIQNGFQSVVNTIRDFAENFYNNMLSLFEPIAQNIEYIVSPIDTNVIETTIEDTNFYGVYDDFTSFTSTFDNAFNIQEPDSFTITIHVEDIDLLNQQNPYILNLGANFYPIRSALRTFLWILVTFASVFFVEHNLSSWLKGSGEEK